MSTETDQKPCAAEAFLGTEQTILHGQGKNRRPYKGTVVEWRFGTSTIEKMSAPEDGSRPLAFPTFELKLQMEDGTKSRWIGPFIDRNNGYPSDLWLGDVETLNRRDPSYLLLSIRRTLFGYCASEPVHQQLGDDEWGQAAFWAFEDICELVEKHFPDAN